MLTNLLGRLVRLLFLLIAVAAASFALMMGSPVDPVDAHVGADIAQSHTFNRPVAHVIAGKFLTNLALMAWPGACLACSDSVSVSSPVCGAAGSPTAPSPGGLTRWRPR